MNTPDTPNLTIRQHQLRLEDATADVYDLKVLNLKYHKIGGIPDESLPSGQEKHRFVLSDYGLSLIISRDVMYEERTSGTFLHITVIPVNDAAAASFIRASKGSVLESLRRLFRELMPAQNLEEEGVGTAPGGVVHFIFKDVGHIKYGLIEAA